MTAHTPKTTAPRTRNTRKRSGASSLVITGDSAVEKSSVRKLKRARVSKRPPEPERVDAPPILISVDLNAGPATVSRYAGLFFMFVGVLFATYSLSGMYVELVELSVSDQRAFAPKAQMAQVITGSTMSVPVATPVTKSVSAPSPAVSSPAQTASTTPATTTTPSAPASTPVTVTYDRKLMEPEVELAVRGGAPHEGVEEVALRVADASRVELLLTPRESLTERYLGRAQRVATDSWKFTFDTRNTPNGDYVLYARVTNSYGSYQSAPVPLRIKNEVPFMNTTTATATPESAANQAQIQAEIANVAIEFKASEPRTDLGTAVVPMIAKTKPPSSTPNETKTQSGSTTPEEEATSLPPPLEERAHRFIETIDSDLSQMLELYGVAIRGNDPGAIAQMEEQLSDFELEIAKRVEAELVGEGMVASPDEAAAIRERIVSLAREERVRREKEERLILDRVGDKIKRDSDRDGISDYDETHLYQTDPFTADSDADGFTDGAEVLSGFDPANEVREVMVAFEDPRENGTERPDILEVSRLDVLQPENADTTAEAEQNILLSGVALPNSFVTLYIYSTPVVVTVKTNDDGSWSYSFDKELEDGQHEVYIGVTDNAGKLVAKSKPFAFVKTANAYAVGRVQSEPVVVSSPTPRLMSENTIILVTSLVVIMVGLVLVLIGAFLARRPHPALAPSLRAV